MKICNFNCFRKSLEVYKIMEKRHKDEIKKVVAGWLMHAVIMNSKFIIKSIKINLFCWRMTFSKLLC